MTLTLAGAYNARRYAAAATGGATAHTVIDPMSEACFPNRRATSGQANKLNGGSMMTLTGAVYAPAQPAEWTGNNGSAASNCTRVIARTVTFIGNSYFNNGGCEEAGVKPIEVTSVRVSA